MNNTTIQFITVIPYSKLTCLYFINDGDRHATTYEKINSMLSELTPNLIYKFTDKLSKRVPFCINLIEMTLYELESEKELKKDKSVYDDLSKIKKENKNPPYTDALEDQIRKTIKEK